jgi:hypothetical protein
MVCNKKSASADFIIIPSSIVPSSMDRYHTCNELVCYANSFRKEKIMCVVGLSTCWEHSMKKEIQSIEYVDVETEVPAPNAARDERAILRPGMS